MNPLVVDCDGFEPPGGRGNGWRLAWLLPSRNPIELSGSDLWCEWNGTPEGFLLSWNALWNLGLCTGEWSGVHGSLAEHTWVENIWGGEYASLSESGPCGDEEPRNSRGFTTEEWQRSTVLNLFGLRAGLEKPVVGALLGGSFSLSEWGTLSTFSCWWNPLRR